MFDISFAILLVLCGHVLRSVRHYYMIKDYYKCSISDLLLPLTLGSFFNIFLQFKIGELLRIYLIHKKTSISYKYITNTVIFDRFLDLAVILFSVILISVFFIDFENISNLILFSIAFIFLFLVYISNKQILKLIYKISLIFNNQIKENILLFFLIQKKILELIIKNYFNFIVLTISMWFFYFSSLYFLVKATNSSFFAIFNNIYINNIEIYNYTILIYFILPLIIIGIYLLLKNISTSRTNKLGSLLNIARDKIYSNKENILFSFLNNTDVKDQYLESFFMSKNTNIEKFCELNENIEIIKNISGGSDALTFVIYNDDRMFVRKIAFNNASYKLKEQYEWINKFSKTLPLPITTTSFDNIEDNIYMYDMEYKANSISMFEYIHTNSIDKSWIILKNTIEILEKNLYANKYKIEQIVIDEYIKLKFFDNIEKFRNSSSYIKKFSDYDNLIINDKEYKNINYYLGFLKEKKIFSIFDDLENSDIHGDLTLENILFDKDLIIIDPNPANIYNHKFIDFAKLRQSLNKGYEFLTKVNSYNINENIINYVCPKSNMYTKLSNKYDDFIIEKYSKETLNKIMLHEIIHYTRMLPYKIKYSEEYAIVFYSVLIILLDDLEKMYEK